MDAGGQIVLVVGVFALIGLIFFVVWWFFHLLLLRNRHGHASQGWIFNKTLRFREGVIEPGEQVAVLGWAEREIDPEPGGAGHGFRDPASRVVLRGSGVQPLRVSGVQPLRVSDDPSTVG